MRRRPGRRVTTETDTATTETDDEPETGPLRRCIVTRERLAKERMIRFVVGPDRAVVPDLGAKLPGRGMWLSARGDVLESARTRGAFARAARAPVNVPQDLADRVRAGITHRIGELLGLARRAGQAVAGHEKAREWLRTGRAALILQASDGSDEERRRFLGGAKDIPVLAPLSAAVLGTVFGRDRVVHVAVAPGKLVALLTAEAERLAGLEPVRAAAGVRRVEGSGEARQAGTKQASR
jgi:predicted RNA-binding protein YlxR (DUF448 family)